MPSAPPPLSFALPPNLPSQRFRPVQAHKKTEKFQIANKNNFVIPVSSHKTLCTIRYFPFIQRFHSGPTGNLSKSNALKKFQTCLLTAEIFWTALVKSSQLVQFYCHQSFWIKGGHVRGHESVILSLKMEKSAKASIPIFYFHFLLRSLCQFSCEWSREREALEEGKLSRGGGKASFEVDSLSFLPLIKATRGVRKPKIPRPLQLINSTAKNWHVCWARN